MHLLAILHLRQRLTLTKILEGTLLNSLVMEPKMACYRHWCLDKMLLVALEHWPLKREALVMLDTYREVMLQYR